MKAWHAGLLSNSTVRGETSKISPKRVIAETGESLDRSNNFRAYEWKIILTYLTDLFYHGNATPKKGKGKESGDNPKFEQSIQNVTLSRNNKERLHR